MSFESEIKAKHGIDFGSIYKEFISGLDYVKHGFFHPIKVKYVKSHSFETQVEPINPLFYLFNHIVLIINA